MRKHRRFTKFLSDQAGTFLLAVHRGTTSQSVFWNTEGVNHIPPVLNYGDKSHKRPQQIVLTEQFGAQVPCPPAFRFTRRTARDRPPYHPKGRFARAQARPPLVGRGSPLPAGFLVF